MYSSYNLYYAIPYVPLYFGLSSFLSTFTGLLLINANAVKNMTVTEILLSETKEDVRFVFLNGKHVDCKLASVELRTFERNRYNLLI